MAFPGSCFDVLFFFFLVFVLFNTAANIVYVMCDETPVKHFVFSAIQLFETSLSNMAIGRF